MRNNKNGRQATFPTVAVISCIFLMLVSGRADAQLVKGRLVDREAQLPISWAFVVLMDTAHVQVASSLANKDGQFALRAPRPGIYSLRVQRLGYQTANTGAVALANDTTIEWRIAPAAIVLPAITARVNGRCGKQTNDSEAAALLFEEVRKTLTVLSWSNSNVKLSYDIEERSGNAQELGSQPVQELRLVRYDGGRGGPFQSISADSVLKSGFIQAGGSLDGYKYFGPDAELILSPEFKRSHCFRPVNDRSNPGTVGLAFEPNGIIKPYDIRGVLLLNSRTFELEKLTFSYAALPVDAPAGSARGEVNFERLPDGFWIVNDWIIRTPVMSTASGTKAPAVYMDTHITHKRVITAYVDGKPVFQSDYIKK